MLEEGLSEAIIIENFNLIRFIADWIFLKNADSWILLVRLMNLRKEELQRAIRQSFNKI